MDPNKLISNHHQKISRLIRSIAFKYSIKGDEVDDFEQLVFERLLENDAKKLQAYKGKGSLLTFLKTVITRICIDELRKEKVRRNYPSRTAKKLGDLGVVVEHLYFQKEKSLEETYQIIANNYQFVQLNQKAKEQLKKLGLPEEVLEALSAIFNQPYMSKKNLGEKIKFCIEPEMVLRFQSLIFECALSPDRETITSLIETIEKRNPLRTKELSIPDIEDTYPSPEIQQEEKRLGLVEEKIQSALVELRKSLTHQEGLLLKLFEQGANLSEIATILGQSRYHTEKQIQSITLRFKEALLHLGIHLQDIEEILKK